MIKDYIFRGMRVLADWEVLAAFALKRSVYDEKGHRYFIGEKDDINKKPQSKERRLKGLMKDYSHMKMSWDRPLNDFLDQKLYSSFPITESDLMVLHEMTKETPLRGYNTFAALALGAKVMQFTGSYYVLNDDRGKLMRGSGHPDEADELDDIMIWSLLDTKFTRCDQMTGTQHLQDGNRKECTSLVGDVCSEVIPMLSQMVSLLRDGKEKTCKMDSDPEKMDIEHLMTEIRREIENLKFIEKEHEALVNDHAYLFHFVEQAKHLLNEDQISSIEELISDPPEAGGEL